MKEVFEFIFPGMMLMWVFFIGQNAMSDFFTEQARKTLPRMLATTVTVSQLLISKMLRCMLLCLISEIFLIVFTTLVFKMNWGNPFLLFVILCLVNLAFTGIMAMVYALSKTKTQADAISILVILFSSFLGGSMIPYREMPAILQTFASLTIVRWGILGLQTLIYSEPLYELVKPAIILFCIGVVTTPIGMWFFKRRIESGGLS